MRKELRLKYAVDSIPEVPRKTQSTKNKAPFAGIRLRTWALGLVFLLMITGCKVGHKLYQTSFTQYNEAVRNTLDEQMLANLVRIRYLQSPIFLQVSSLNTSFAIGGNIGANAGNGGTYGASIGGSYEERPTISFSMPESRLYYGRLLAPLSADQITSLILAGFDSDIVFQTSVRGINGLQNQNADLTNLLEDPLFEEVISLIKKLRSERIIDLELGGKETFWSSPVKVEAKTDISQVLLLGAASYAMSNDAEIVAYPEGNWQTHRYEKHMALRFSPASDDSQDAQKLKKLLGLEPDRYNFPMVEAEMVNAEKARGVLGQSPGALDSDVIWTEIGVRGRSMLEIMQVASKDVQVPNEDIERGIASPNRTQDIPGAGWLVIKSSDSEPKNTTISIELRGHWFYIDDTDLRSRESFAMLTALFAVVGGTVPGAHPVLTLPVGN